LLEEPILGVLCSDLTLYFLDSLVMPSQLGLNRGFLLPRLLKQVLCVPERIAELFDLLLSHLDSLLRFLNADSIDLSALLTGEGPA
jgi:hypothetical protein